MLYKLVAFFFSQPSPPWLRLSVPFVCFLGSATHLSPPLASSSLSTSPLTALHLSTLASGKGLAAATRRDRHGMHSLSSTRFQVLLKDISAIHQGALDNLLGILQEGLLPGGFKLLFALLREEPLLGESDLLAESVVTGIERDVLKGVCGIL